MWNKRKKLEKIINSEDSPLIKMLKDPRFRWIRTQYQGLGYTNDWETEKTRTAYDNKWPNEAVIADAEEAMYRIDSAMHFIDTGHELGRMEHYSCFPKEPSSDSTITLADIFNFGFQPIEKKYLYYILGKKIEGENIDHLTKKICEEIFSDDPLKKEVFEYIANAVTEDLK